MRAQRGSSVVEALVSAALAGVALGGLAATGSVAVRAVRTARDTSQSLALAIERLESLRAGPRVSGRDGSVAPDGTRFVRSWEVEDGRGAPDRVTVELRWAGRSLAMSTEAWP